MELVNRLLIGRKLAQLDTYLGQISEFSKISVSAYKSDWKTQRIVERTLQMLIELCIDIANHIISDGGMRLPSGYADTFAVLMENKVINRNLLKTLDEMAKFRNVVVHQYEKIDPAIVISILHNNLKDFKNYKKAIIKYLSL
ncbi:MAG TPA: DUF86 domain-containing protein [Thermodesulfovibrionales bacterium]|nr:DUF86 domain-containing protein [Thermodesulfovibrionales bacterium]